jgi:hypothetical protein
MRNIFPKIVDLGGSTKLDQDEWAYILSNLITIVRRGHSWLCLEHEH